MIYSCQRIFFRGIHTLIENIKFSIALSSINDFKVFKIILFITRVALAVFVWQNWRDREIEKTTCQKYK